jgi:predicted lipid-binding transport protein (Tim44 family)
MPSAEASAEDRGRASSPPDSSRPARIATASLGGLLGGLVGGALVLAVTVALKAMIDFVSAEATVEVIVVPLLGLALTT